MIVTRIRAAAARIWQYPQLDAGYKKILYHGWVQSQLMFNGICFLPFATKNQLSALQRAQNAAVRSVMGIRLRPGAPNKSMKRIRQKLGIRSVESIKDHLIATQTWKDRHTLAQMTATRSQNTRLTRNSLPLQPPRETPTNR